VSETAAGVSRGIDRPVHARCHPWVIDGVKPLVWRGSPSFCTRRVHLPASGRLRGRHRPRTAVEVPGMNGACVTMVNSSRGPTAPASGSGRALALARSATG
jgi:hypothetical protein